MPHAGRREPSRRTHRVTGIRSWWRILVEWRNWRLPVKVAAVLAVPALAAITLGAVEIGRDIGNAGDYSRIQQLVALRTSLRPLVTDLQQERWLVAEKLGTRIPVGLPDYFTANNEVDAAAQTVTGLGGRLLTSRGIAGLRYQGLAAQLSELGVLHRQALQGDSDAITVVSNYTAVIKSVLDLEQALSTQLGDPGLTGSASAMTDLEIAQEQVREQQAIVAVVISRGQVQAVELTTLTASDGLMADRIEDYQVVATPAELARYQRQSVTSALNSREAFAQTVLSNGQTLMEVGDAGPGTGSLGVPATSWRTASDTAAVQLGGISRELGTQLRATATDLRSRAVRSAWTEAVIVFGVLLLAAAVGFVVGRHLLRQLKVLRGTALRVAEERLPEVVAGLESGELSDPRIEPVPLHTREELGQLARAFDAVHSQAVRSAVGQAALRRNLRTVFVNLSRRSQSLVERQLRLMERLERNEEDPRQLANLFRLDHLATRMRRNNENLMVLSGDDPARRSGRPLSLADVLRAAVSEIEHYQRVVVRSTPTVDVLGYAAGDLVRLVAELLDNATSFSPPTTQVRVGGQAGPDGSIRIEIADEGIGMGPAELADANGRLTESDGPEVPVSRQMGLYVIGRLARRHGIEVALRPVPDGGLLAVVDVPGDLVKPIEEPAAAAADTHVLLPFVATDHPAVPDLPVVSGSVDWGSPVGVSLPDPAVSLAPTGFTWFNCESREDRPAPSSQPSSQPVFPPGDVTAVGLPRRVPRAHAVPNLVSPAGRRGQPRSAADPSRRDATRARGFLNDYQSGLRRQPAADPGREQGRGDSR